MKHLMSVFVFVLQVAAFSAFAANTWYVDDDNYGKTGLDGVSAATAFGTIQDAIQAATTQEGDTILVLPGTYDKDYVRPEDPGMSGLGLWHNTRVVVTKKNLTIRSTGGKEVTHIVGASDPEAPENRFGAWSNAVSCVTVAWNRQPFVLDGFTLREGKCCRPDITSNARNNGGAVGYYTGGSSDLKSQIHVFDCAISNCVSRMGPANSCTLHRCLVANNRSYDDNDAGIAYGLAENCIFLSPKSGSVATRSPLVNCTVMGVTAGTSRATSLTPYLANTILAANQHDCDGGSDSVCCYTNCVSTGRVLATNAFREDRIFNTVTNAVVTNLFVSPLFGDFRLIAGSCAVGRADPRILRETIAMPEGYTFKDYLGNPIDMGADTINAGAIQSVVVPKGGFATVSMAQNVDRAWALIDGRPLQLMAYGANYVWVMDEGPVQWRVTAADPSANPLACVAMSPGLAHYAGAKGEVWTLMPRAGEAIAYTLDCASRFYYVDPVNGNDAYDGTCAWEQADVANRKGPWRTLMYAATNSVLNNSYRTRITCAPGRYAEGGISDRYRGRVWTAGGRRIHFVGAEGAEKTFIFGAPDPETGARGPKAMRCIANDSQFVGFTGFTLTNGYTHAETTSWPGYYASAAYSGTENLGLVECVLTGCNGRSGVVYSGTQSPQTGILLERCLVKNNIDYYVVIGNVMASGCVFADNDTSEEDTDWFYGGTFLNCTAYLPSVGGKGWASRRQNANFYNMLFVNASFPNGQGAKEGRGCVLENCQTSNLKGFSDAVTGEAYLARPSAGDFRVGADSVAWGAAVTDLDCLATLATTDYLGNPLVTNRTIAATGAVLKQSENGVCVVCPEGNLAVSGTYPTGAHDLRPGETLSVSINPAANRPVGGVVINGVTNDFVSATAEITVSYEDVLAAGGSLSIHPAGTGEWYVNPNTDSAKGVVGDDANLGYSPLFPKRTLKGVASLATKAGDVIHAAAGVYDDETMNRTVAKQPSRVEVADGVLLVSEAGRDQTIIKGATGNLENGFGDGAVRCVYLGKGATVRGFTLTDGHLVSTEEVSDREHCGAGVSAYAYNGRDVYIEDCVISNCVARRYTFFAGTYRGCEIIANTALAEALAYSATFYSTLFARNVLAPNDLRPFRYGRFENITFAADNVTTEGQSMRSTYLGAGDENDYCCNSLLYNISLHTVAATNCVFVNVANPTRSTFVNCRTMSVAEAALDENYRPVLGESLLVDVGTNACRAIENYDTWCRYDAAGNPRISNGTIDVGAYEADWRPVYTRDTCRGMTVVAASPSVTESPTKGVLLGANGQVVVDLNTPVSGKANAFFIFRVDGTGTLTASWGDGVTRTFTAQAEDQTLQIKDTGVTRVTFAYTPGENDTASAEFFKGFYKRGLVVVFR